MQQMGIGPGQPVIGQVPAVVRNDIKHLKLKANDNENKFLYSYCLWMFYYFILFYLGINTVFCLDIIC